MSITVKRGTETVSSEIHFTSMSPWDAQPKTITHEPEGADYSIIYHKGMKSKTTTLKGYCKRTAENVAIMQSLKDGTILEITHSVEGTHKGICTSCPLSESTGGLWITFSMTVVEQ